MDVRSRPDYLCAPCRTAVASLAPEADIREPRARRRDGAGGSGRPGEPAGEDEPLDYGTQDQLELCPRRAGFPILLIRPAKWVKKVAFWAHLEIEASYLLSIR